MLNKEFKTGYIEHEVARHNEKGIPEIPLVNCDFALKPVSSTMEIEEDVGVLDHFYVFSALSKTIGYNTKTCPVCKYDIEKYIVGFLEGEKARSPFGVGLGLYSLSKEFKCPYCKTKFYLMNTGFSGVAFVNHPMDATSC